MTINKVLYINAWPYQADIMNLPVRDLQAAAPFYETIMGFQRKFEYSEPYKSIHFERGMIQIGLAENGGDPSQDGCFIEVDDVEKAAGELKSNGLNHGISEFKFEKHGETHWKIFYIVAPDGLCYCLGERQI